MAGTDILSYDKNPKSQQVSDGSRPHFYPTLMYATGPGKKSLAYDVSKDGLLSRKDYRHPALVFRESAAHQGIHFLFLYGWNTVKIKEMFKLHILLLDFISFS